MAVSRPRPRSRCQPSHRAVRRARRHRSVSSSAIVSCSKSHQDTWSTNPETWKSNSCHPPKHIDSARRLKHRAHARAAGTRKVPTVRTGGAFRSPDFRGCRRAVVRSPDCLVAWPPRSTWCSTTESRSGGAACAMRFRAPTDCCAGCAMDTRRASTSFGAFQQFPSAGNHETVGTLSAFRESCSNIVPVAQSPEFAFRGDTGPLNVYTSAGQRRETLFDAGHGEGCRPTESLVNQSVCEEFGSLRLALPDGDVGRGGPTEAASWLDEAGLLGNYKNGLPLRRLLRVGRIVGQQ